ncbi:hypothetical protein [Oricola sp.]|uniref:hypothetical protein n=1 Tax=Oricola sp. TaxID=1979950 RepID=UPI0025EAEFA3|nr:hypothetical protein [Oricola sp.]MCI5077489.1 hypothetical protein [Oricola sp.]
MRAHNRLSAAFILAAALATPAQAQEQAPQQYPFAGGVIEITENADYLKVVTFNGREIGRDYFAFFDRVVTVEDYEVALLSLGDGGNACAPGTLMVWPDGEGGVKADKFGGDCPNATPAVSDFRILFVPWVGPGEELPITSWSPTDGFGMAGVLRFAAEPDTAWADLAKEPIAHPIDYFSNAAFLENASAMLGEELYDYALGLRVSTDMEPIGDSFYAARGCVPHDCGGADSLLVVDFNRQTAWFAQQRGQETVLWPARAEWPEAALDALHSLGPL